MSDSVALTDEFIERMLDDFFEDPEAFQAFKGWLPRQRQYARLLKGTTPSKINKGLARHRLVQLMLAEDRISFVMAVLRPDVLSIAREKRIGPKRFEQIMAVHGPIRSAWILLAASGETVAEDTYCKCLDKAIAAAALKPKQVPESPRAKVETPAETEKCDSSRERKALERECRELGKQLEAMRLQVKRLNAEKARLAGLETEVESLRGKNAYLESVVQQHTEWLREATTGREDVKTHLHREEVKLANAERALEEERRARIEVERERDEQAAAVARLDGTVGTLMTELSEALDGAHRIGEPLALEAVRQTLRVRLREVASAEDLDVAQAHEVTLALSALGSAFVRDLFAEEEVEDEPIEDLPAEEPETVFLDEADQSDESRAHVVEISEPVSILDRLSPAEQKAIELRHCESDLEYCEEQLLAGAEPAYLILDGHNIILRKHHGERPGREWLESLAPALVARTGASVLIAFDSKFHLENTYNGPGYRVVFCPKAQGGADARIIEEINVPRAGLTVVASDDFKHVLRESDVLEAEGCDVMGVTGASMHQYLVALEAWWKAGGESMAG